MAQDNIYWPRLLPYHFVPTPEMRSDLSIPIITEKDFLNNDFLDQLAFAYYNGILSNLNFDYFTPDKFNAEIRKTANNVNFSLFHMNIHSLNKNSDELCQFLNVINHDFDVIVLFEIWSYNIDIYGNLLPGYIFHYDLPAVSNVGGIGIYIKNSLSHCVTDNYKINNTDLCKIENLWLEVTKGNSKYIIGGIYRHPGQKLVILQKYSIRLSPNLPKVKFLV